MTDDRRRGWKNAAFCAVVAALLLAPHLFTGTPASPYPVFGPARVLSDDEPHYLLIINSLLNDGDLDLANNYSSVHAGGQDAGAFWGGGRKLDDHTVFIIHGRPRFWVDYYPFTDTQWRTDADGVVHPVPATPGDEPPPGAPEL